MNKYAEHIAEVARDLWGDENKKLSHGSQLRFGSHGSKSVDTEKGTWYDHETQESGGFTDLCKIAYPEANGHLADFLDTKFGIEKDPSFASQTRDQITTYDYIGDHGVMEYQVIRIDYADGSKTFRQQRPDGKGGWIRNLKGVRKIPYNLPEILHHKKRAVWIVEGEKCVDRLREIGIVATTNNGGSGNWTEEHSEWLKDRKVVVVPDNDEAGQKHAAKVINSLVGVAEDIKLLDLSTELPNKGDIVDWLDTGKTKESLVAKARAAKSVTDKVEDPGEIKEEQPKVFEVMRLQQLMSMPPVQWLADSLLTRHGFSVMYGKPGCGKTFVALDLALSVASGRDFHDMPTKQGAVLYIAGEGVGGLGKRVKAWINNRGGGCVEHELPFYILPTAVNLAAPADLQTLLSTIDQLSEESGSNFSLVVVDTVARALLGADENSATDIGKFVAACDTIKEHTAAAVLGIHHSGKDNSKGMRGSSALLGAVDTSINVKRSDGVVTLVTEKQKDAEPAEDILFEMVSTDTGTIAEETSVYLNKVSAADVASKTANLNEVQMKAMNCLRDATSPGGEINLAIARDSFNFWLAEKEGLDLTQDKAKARARMSWRRAIDALIDANIVLFAPGGKKATWMQETNSSEQETNGGEQDESL